MAIKLKRKDGIVTPYRNSEYIPLFYMLPKDMLEKAGKKFLELPRYPILMYVDWNVIEFIESDLFFNFIIDGTAYLVWTYMNTGAKREIYSGYEPSWQFAHAPQYWLKAFIDEGVILSSDALYKFCNTKPDKKIQVCFMERCKYLLELRRTKGYEAVWYGQDYRNGERISLF